jgi:predicted HTH transcriptional regulator
MTEDVLKKLLDEFLTLHSETEWLEFKEAKDNYDFNKLGEYFSALSNEANLKGKPYGWLIFGIDNKTRNIVGTGYRPHRNNLDSLKLEIANKTTNRITFMEIHELHLPKGRVIMFQIPAAPKGIPIAWEGHYYGRDGQSIGALNLQEIEQIRIEGRYPNLFVAAKIAAVTGDKASYIKNRAFDKEHYKKMIIAFIKEYRAASRQDINNLIIDKLSDALDEKQKRNKITNLLSEMAKKDKTIKNTGSDKKPNWILT